MTACFLVLPLPFFVSQKQFHLQVLASFIYFICYNLYVEQHKLLEVLRDYLHLFLHTTALHEYIIS